MTNLSAKRKLVNAEDLRVLFEKTFTFGWRMNIFQNLHAAGRNANELCPALMPPSRKRRA